MKQLKDAVDSTHKMHIGLQNAAAEALQAAERPGFRKRARAVHPTRQTGEADSRPQTRDSWVVPENSRSRILLRLRLDRADHRRSDEKRERIDASDRSIRWTTWPKTQPRPVEGSQRPSSNSHRKKKTTRRNISLPLSTRSRRCHFSCQLNYFSARWLPSTPTRDAADRIQIFKSRTRTSYLNWRSSRSTRAKSSKPAVFPDIIRQHSHGDCKGQLVVRYLHPLRAVAHVGSAPRGSPQL